MGKHFKSVLRDIVTSSGERYTVEFDVKDSVWHFNCPQIKLSGCTKQKELDLAVVVCVQCIENRKQSLIQLIQTKLNLIKSTLNDLHQLVLINQNAEYEMLSQLKEAIVAKLHIMQSIQVAKLIQLHELTKIEEVYLTITLYKNAIERNERMLEQAQKTFEQQPKQQQTAVRKDKCAAVAEQLEQLKGVR